MAEPWDPQQRYDDISAETPSVKGEMPMMVPVIAGTSLLSPTAVSSVMHNLCTGAVRENLIFLSMIIFIYTKCMIFSYNNVLTRELI